MDPAMILTMTNEMEQATADAMSQYFTARKLMSAGAGINSLVPIYKAGVDKMQEHHVRMMNYYTG
jgi:hypothetical protein